MILTALIVNLIGSLMAFVVGVWAFRESQDALGWVLLGIGTLNVLFLVWVILG